MSFDRWFNRTLNRTWGYIEDRSGMPKWALRPQPDFTFKPSYWTGGFVATAFLYQVISGALLLLYYQPIATAGSFLPCGQTPGTPSLAPGAWCSTFYIINSVPLGSILLSTHLYGAYAMIFLAFVHFYRGYYLGVYKKPREFSWMVGTLLLILTLGMGFTGYLLPYTQLAYNATSVGLVIALRLPIAGPLLGPLILGDGTPQGLLSRMFAAHVLLIPVALGALLYAHIALFESHGIAPPATSDPTQRRRFTESEGRSQVPFMPQIFFYITKWALVYIGLIFGIAALWPWNLPTYVGNLAAVGVVTEPDWYFLWLFKLVDFQGVTPVLAVGITTVIILYVLLLPYLDRSARTHPRDRPVFLFAGLALVQFFILMSVWGALTPGLSIAPQEVVMRLAPMFLVDLVVVAFLYRRYQRRYRARMLAAGGAARLGGAYASTHPIPPSTTVRPPEATSRE